MLPEICGNCVPGNWPLMYVSNCCISHICVHAVLVGFFFRLSCLYMRERCMPVSVGTSVRSVSCIEGSLVLQANLHAHLVDIV